MTKQFPLLNKKDIEVLDEALYYMNMEELKQACEELELSVIGKKRDLIHRMLTFIQTGKIVKIKPIPALSKAEKGREYPLSAKTVILYGAYKNDLKTRLFMKKLVGDYFHFTAFGQDWMKERWYAGNPPTYAEFADFWIREYNHRKISKANPKQEWAYLNFIQRYTKQHPQTSKDSMMAAWKKQRAEKAAVAQKILKKI